MPPEHGAGLGVGQVGSGLSVDSQDEIANPETSIPANGSSVDYAADQHPQTVFQGAHCHPFEEDEQLFDLSDLSDLSISETVDQLGFSHTTSFNKGKYPKKTPC